MKGSERLWQFRSDMNADGATTISDVWEWFVWLYFYPGDLLIRWLVGSAAGRFFELTAKSYGGLFSGIVSGVFWFVVLVAFLSLPAKLADDYRLSRARYRRDLEANVSIWRREIHPAVVPTVMGFLLLLLAFYAVIV